MAMLLAVQWTWQIDGWIILTGAICAAASALLGNFLVLRRMSLMGDAISHAVLPGLAAAFLFTGQRQGTAMFLGAAAVGVLTVLLTELARKYGKVEESAAIGVVFTSLFALGLLMIVRAADRVDLDPDCVLYGALETAVIDQRPFLGWMVPRVAIQLLGVLLLNLVFVFCFFRHLKVSTFDPQLAKSQGVAVSALHYALAACVAVTAVASFESVGNILVVAMFVVPPVTAWLLTDRLWLMVTLSVVVGMSASLLGHWAAKEIPTWFGYGSSNTAGMMAVASGGLLLVALLFAPRKGVLSRAWRSLQVGVQVLSEDVLAMLYRAESGGEESLPINEIRRRLSVSELARETAILVVEE